MLIDTILRSVTPTVAVLLIPAALVLYEIVWIVYAKTFHPLAKVPGPWLASVSRWWYIRRLRRGDMDQTQRDLHEKHGPLVRIAPNEIACSDPDAIKKLYKSHDPLTKTDFYPVWGNTISPHPDHFSSIDERVHSERRRIVSHVYSLSNVLQSEACIDRCTVIIIDKLNEFAKSKRICDLGGLLQWYTFDVMGELFFGRMFGFLEKGEDHESWIASLDDLMPGFCSVAVAPTYMRPFIIATALIDPTMRGAMKCTSTMVTAAKQGVAARKADPSLNDREKAGRDLLQQLLDLKRDKGEKFDFDIPEVEQEAYTALLAGSDTTAIAIRAVFYFLMRDEKVYRQVQAEIDAAAAKGELSFPVKYAEAIKMPLLCASIKEAMRMHPSVALTMPRLMPAGGMEFNGTFIPQGYRVGVNAAVVHYDKGVFGPDADQFRPGRWIGRDSATAARMERTMIHFGGGTRTCIGKNISLAELHKLVPTVLSKFDVELEDRNRPWTLNNQWFNKQSGIRVRLTARS